jgi:hypothetical protein
MAKQLGRWRCSTSLIGAREDAYLPSIADDDVPRRARTHDGALDEGEGDEPRGRRQEHVHIYLPSGLYGQPAPRRTPLRHRPRASLVRPLASPPVAFVYSPAHNRPHTLNNYLTPSAVVRDKIPRRWLLRLGRPPTASNNGLAGGGFSLAEEPGNRSATLSKRACPS